MAAWAGRHFSLGRGPRGKLCADGLNYTYLLEQGRKKHALRLYRPGWRSAEQVDFELAQLRFLHAVGLPVARPLPAKDGRFSVPVRLADGPSRGVLFSFAPGSPRPEKPVLPAAKQVGTLLARLHEAQDLFAPKAALPPMDQQRLVSLPLAQLRPFKASFGEDWAWLQSSAALIRRSLDRLPKTAPAFGLIHGDPHNWNMNYDAKTGVYTLFDFDLSTRGWRLFDLATFLWGSGWPEKGFGAGSRALLQSYAQQRPLSPVELRELPAMMAARHLWWMGFQASLAWRTGTEAVMPIVHQRKLAFLRRWRSGKLAKQLRVG